MIKRYKQTENELNKKIIISILLIIVVISIVIIIFVQKNSKQTSNNIEINNTNTNIKNNEEVEQNTINKNKVDDMSLIFIKVNNQILNVELENNSATKELKEKLKNGDVIVEAQEYGGFEKVGDLGFYLPREDKNITTTSGDIVLYQGNQISLFYDSNSWSYTKIGKIINVDNQKLKSILGNGNVILTVTLAR